MLVNTAPAETPGSIALESLTSSKSAERLQQSEQLRKKGDITQALKVLEKQNTPADTLMRARLLRAQKKSADALSLLESALTQNPCAPFDTLLRIEQALNQITARQDAEGTESLFKLVKEDHLAAREHIVTLVQALSRLGPKLVLEKVPALLELRRLSPNTRSYLLKTIADAYLATGKKSLAHETRLESFLTVPLGRSSPSKAPEHTRPGPEQLLARAELILQAHRNESALRALKLVPSSKLSATQMCRFLFAEGLAHRKLHNYGSAEKSLMKAARTCVDSSMRRRAGYVGIKVITIRRGLDAIDPIEAFAKEFKGHSMVDDLLFWAGDLYQRRKRFDEAHAYYQRIQELLVAGDHCGEATWRRAWIYYRNEEPVKAEKILNASLKQTSCTPKKSDRARALYWLGRISLDQGKKARAARRFERVLDEAPLNYYAQLALTRLQEVDAPRLSWLEGHLQAPKTADKNLICTGALGKDIYFQNGIALLKSGLLQDAGLYLRRVTHGLGLTRGENCQPMQADLLVALLLNKAGYEQEAHWQVRSAFATELQKIPTPDEAGIFFAAYPMAYSEEIAAAEHEHGIPTLFLQALAREESAFDPQVVSWAGAYGLTQLLLSTAKSAGKMLTPQINITKASELFDPALNAKLGGAFMASLISRFKGSTGLALCGYNAALKTANTWWKRHAGDAFDIFAEELTIKETRKYVKRVHQTWGIYRWLYQGIPPSLPTDPIPGATQTALR